jgi:hypothetical protein
MEKRIEICYLGKFKYKGPVFEDEGKYIPIKDLKNKKSGKTTVSSQEQSL